MNNKSTNQAAQGSGETQSAPVRKYSDRRPVSYGLPCAHCKAYYASELAVCPICSCGERVTVAAALVSPAVPL